MVIPSSVLSGNLTMSASLSGLGTIAFGSTAPSVPAGTALGNTALTTQVGYLLNQSVVPGQSAASLAQEAIPFLNQVFLGNLATSPVGAGAVTALQQTLADVFGTSLEQHGLSFLDWVNNDTLAKPAVARNTLTVLDAALASGPLRGCEEMGRAGDVSPLVRSHQGTYVPRSPYLFTGSQHNLCRGSYGGLPVLCIDLRAHDVIGAQPGGGNGDIRMPPPGDAAGVSALVSATIDVQPGESDQAVREAVEAPGGGIVVPLARRAIRSAKSSDGMAAVPRRLGHPVAFSQSGWLAAREPVVGRGGRFFRRCGKTAGGPAFTWRGGDAECWRNGLGRDPARPCSCSWL